MEQTEYSLINSQNDTCTSIVAAFISMGGSLTVSEFESWNPALGADCSGLQSGYYYCIVSANANIGSIPTVTTSPTPMQTGSIKSCNRWYKARDGDNCETIVIGFGTFSQSQFIQWNPAVGSSCSNIIVGDYYCIGIPGTPASKTSPIPSTTPAPIGTGPQPEQSGITSHCKKYWFVGQ